MAYQILRRFQNWGRPRGVSPTFLRSDGGRFVKPKDLHPLYFDRFFNGEQDIENEFSTFVFHTAKKFSTTDRNVWKEEKGVKAKGLQKGTPRVAHRGLWRVQNNGGDHVGAPPEFAVFDLWRPQVTATVSPSK